MSGSGISWAICKSAPHSRQITTPAPHHSVFYRPDALPAAQPTASKHWRQHIHINNALQCSLLRPLLWLLFMCNDHHHDHAQAGVSKNVNSVNVIRMSYNWCCMAAGLLQSTAARMFLSDDMSTYSSLLAYVIVSSVICMLCCHMNSCLLVNRDETQGMLN